MYFEYFVITQTIYKDYYIRVFFIELAFILLLSILCAAGLLIIQTKFVYTMLQYEINKSLDYYTNITICMISDLILTTQISIIE